MVLRLSSEFEAVQVRLVAVGNGHRIEIFEERSGRTALLDATVLAAIAKLGVGDFERILSASVEGPG
ncbi:hypothetical protein ACQP1V_29250 [Microtetraspora malaysiensis]|uniref:hypothetical protein n=1 Tax=Microtetraspora malaysiensis TaxID=161358 RepID=UPI003D902741